MKPLRRTAFRDALLGAAAVLAAGLAIPAESAVAMTLEEALTESYRTNPTLQSARRELGAVNEQVPQALSGWRPTVTLQASGGRQHLSQETSFVAQDASTTPRTYTGEVRQPLYRGGQTVAGTERAERAVAAQRGRLQSTEQDVLLNGVTAYADVWRDEAIVELNEANVDVFRRQLEATQDRFEVGEVTRTDVAQSEFFLAQAIADRITSQGALESSRANFEEIVGLPPEDLEQPTLPGILPATREETVRISLESNPDVVAARFVEASARSQVREVAGRLLPSIDLVGRLSRAEATSTTGESQTEQAEILGQLTIPLYQQGAVYSQVRQARQTASQRRLELATAKRNIEQAAVSSWEDLVTARATITSLEEQVRAAEIALEGVREEQRVGARTVLDVLEAEQDLLEAQVDLVAARRNEIVAGHSVLTAVGRMRAQPLDLPVDLYDVERPYQEVRNKLFGWGIPDEAEETE